MRILAIGNSFSEDACRYIHRLAKADGRHVHTANLYIGGCSLDHHYRNMMGDKQAYTLQFNGESTGFQVSISEALLSGRWDAVTIQQASHYSARKETYQPYATQLAEYIRKYAPKTKLLVHETWAYEEGSSRLHDVGGYETAAAMHADVVGAYAAMAADIKADGIIRSGELLAKLIERGVGPVHRDTFHLSLGIGRYAVGLLWYRTLLGASVLENRFSDFDEPIPEETLAIIRETVESF